MPEDRDMIMEALAPLKNALEEALAGATNRGGLSMGGAIVLQSLSFHSCMRIRTIVNVSALGRKYHLSPCQ